MKKNKEVTRVNSKAAIRNKPSLSKFNFNAFKETLLTYSSPSLAGYDHRSKMLENIQIKMMSKKDKRISRETCLKKIKDLKLYISQEMCSIDYLMMRHFDFSWLTDYLTEVIEESPIQQNTVERQRRPQVNGRFAIILLAALELNVGKRAEKKKIGDYIQINGEFSQEMTLKYGAGAFEKLNVPSVGFTDARWDANLQKQLIPASEKFIKNYFGPRSESDFLILNERVKNLYKYSFTLQKLTDGQDFSVNIDKSLISLSINYKKGFL